MPLNKETKLIRLPIETFMWLDNPLEEGEIKIKILQKKNKKKK